MGSQQWNIPHVAQLKDVEIVIQSRHDFVILQMCVVYVNISAVYPFENSRDVSASAYGVLFRLSVPVKDSLHSLLDANDRKNEEIAAKTAR